MAERINVHRSIRQVALVSGVIYSVLLLILTLVYRPGVGEIAMSFLLGPSAVLVIYLYATKQDMSYASWSMEHGKAPFARFLLLAIAVWMLVAIPWILVG